MLVKDLNSHILGMLFKYICLENAIHLEYYKMFFLQTLRHISPVKPVAFPNFVRLRGPRYLGPLILLSCLLQFWGYQSVSYS